MKIKLSLIELKLIVFIQLKFKSLAITKMKLRNLHRKGLRKVHVEVHVLRNFHFSNTCCMNSLELVIKS